MIASRFELVIFDCDGVLVDSEPVINRAHAELLTACGYPITEQDLVERFCGMSDAEMLASHCGPEHGSRLQACGAALVVDDMHELVTGMSKLV
jgi:beta-phosphoglucomutase-like phosphatase (HAD superfamily)